MTPAGFEPATYNLGGCRSVHLNYGDNMQLRNTVQFSKNASRRKSKWFMSLRQVAVNGYATNVPFRSATTSLIYCKSGRRESNSPDVNIPNVAAYLWPTSRRQEALFSSLATCPVEYN